MDTCNWYVSPEMPECGRDAPHRVKVKTRATTATISLCDGHKAVHDDNFARIRAERKAAALWESHPADQVYGFQFDGSK